jgi:predicted  nucleic acid-binding Zn-ribbon protein
MKNTIILWILAIGTAFAMGWHLRKQPKPQPHDTDKYEHRIDSLKRYNDSLNTLVDINNRDISRLRDSINKVEAGIDRKEDNLNKIKKDYEQKIKRIDSLSSDELTKLLTERYK